MKVGDQVTCKLQEFGYSNPGIITERMGRNFVVEFEKYEGGHDMGKGDGARNRHLLSPETLVLIPQTGKPRKTVKTATAKDMVILIAKFLNRDDYEARMLWDVLSALRGPDDNNISLKEKTTCRLRYAIGLKERGYALIEKGPIVIPDAGTGSGHFREHIYNAKQQLVKMGFNV